MTAMDFYYQKNSNGGDSYGYRRDQWLEMETFHPSDTNHWAKNKVFHKVFL